jgi:dTDP-4-dehydrorhamnose 3,5-epimerase
LKVKFKTEIEQKVHLQDYSRKPSIEGVQIINLHRFNDDGGSFTELLRLKDGLSAGLDNYYLAQVNFSDMDPDCIKAFHVHRIQTDIWFVPPDSKVLLILADLREDSPTNGSLMRFVTGDGNSRLIVIPPGVAHGCKNLGGNRAHLIYFIDQQFTPEPEQCDEWRLPWDYFGAQIWDVQKS